MWVKGWFQITGNRIILRIWKFTDGKGLLINTNYILKNKKQNCGLVESGAERERERKRKSKERKREIEKTKESIREDIGMMGYYK